MKLRTQYDNKTYIIPSFTSYNLSKPVIRTLDELPVIPNKAKFQFMQTVLFPVISVCIYAIVFLLFLGVSFNISYLLIFMGAGLLASLLCGIIGYLYNSNKTQKTEAEMKSKLQQNLKETMEKSIHDGRDFAGRLNIAFPAADLFLGCIDSQRIWERTTDENNGFLIRLGTYTIENPAHVLLPDNINEHVFQKQIMQAISIAKYIENTPYIRALSGIKVLGITGNKAAEYTHMLLSQCLVFYSPDILTVHCLETGRKFAWLNSLVNCRYYSTDTELREAIRLLQEAEHDSGWHVFLSDSAAKAVTSNIHAMIEHCKNRKITLIISQIETDLPFFCTNTIQLIDEKRGIFTSRNGEATAFTPEFLESSEVSAIEAKLTPLRMIPQSQWQSIGIPSSLTFFEMMDINSANELYIQKVNKPSTEGLVVQIGVADGQPVKLDLTKNGPHGILAGATGSGKSQFLLSLILNLAIQYSPEYVNFAFIDYKAEASAMHVKTLPHFAGSFSNLDDEQQIHRVIIMLEQEGLRRQAILNKAVVDGHISYTEIENYNKALQSGNNDLEPLPYLVIIIDEFVDLVVKHNRFLDELSAIARQGRNRGIYILLAAQKPFSVAGSQIVSNAGYVICLRVLSESDSIEAIGKPHAYHIEHKGRGFLKTGDSSIVEFQSAWSGSERQYNGKSLSQLHETVEAICTAWKGYSGKQLFYPALPSFIAFNEQIVEAMCKNKKSGSSSPLTIPIGVADNIYDQRGDFANVLLHKGNILICGDPNTGKTTLLKTFLYIGIHLYTPGEFQFILCGFGERAFDDFEAAPHSGAVMYYTDADRIGRIPRFLRNTLSERKKKLGSHYENHVQYNTDNPSSQLSSIVLAIDKFDIMKETFPDTAHSLEDISLESAKYGIYFIFICTNYNTVRQDARQSVNQVFSFYMEKSTYEQFMTIDRISKPENINGRCLADNGVSTLEVQVALPCDAQTDTIRKTQIKQSLRRIYGKYASMPNILCMPSMPEVIDSSMLNPLNNMLIPIGLAHESLEQIGYRVDKYPVFSISGTAQSGKSSLLYNIAEYITTVFKKPYRIYALDSGDGYLKDLRNSLNYYPADQYKEFFQETGHILQLMSVSNASANDQYTFFLIDDFSYARNKMELRDHSLMDQFSTFLSSVLYSSLIQGLRLILTDMPYRIKSERDFYNPILAYSSGALLGGTPGDRLGAELLQYRLIDVPISQGYGYLVQGNSINLFKMRNDLRKYNQGVDDNA
jgi:DNA segregation ATPase FtsK/SpoIIIE, S-DNA-T family